MNYSRPFNTPRREVRAGEGDVPAPTTPVAAGPRPGITYGASTPAPPVLTRPRAGASIINGQLPQGLPGQPPVTGGPVKARPPQRVPFAGGPSADEDPMQRVKVEAVPPPPLPKQKTQLFDYRYDDTDTIMNELDEFYPYVEMTHVAQNPERFKGSFDGDWTEATSKRRKAYMEIQLEYLESPSTDKRRAAQGRILYLLQGCFAETTSPEMQLHWVIENARTLRSVDGISSLVLGLRDAAKRYNSVSDIPDRPGSSSGTGLSSVDPYDDRSAELMDLLAMLYFVVESCRSDETFGDELMAMSPPLPIVLFQMVAALKDRLPKGYPIKKVLLLLWKTLLACLGGMKEAAKARALSRELAGLPPSDKNFTKASPMDIASFRKDTSLKYPTFAPPSGSSISVSNEKLAEGIRPLPPKANFHSTDIPSTSKPAAPAPPTPAAAAPAPTSNPMPGTPAPTPPGSPAPPKAKKQQYQTDQTKPYIFPFSRSSPSANGIANGGYLVPYAIAEADKLYHRHSYISLGLYQLWEAREDCLREERGLGIGGLIGFSRLAIGEEEIDEAEEEAMRREWKFEEEEMEADIAGDEAGVKRARERRQASRRLHRVDIIYKSTLPIMQSCVIVLLKLLLATVTGPGVVPVGGGGAASPPHEVPPTTPNTVPTTREEVDIARHREITSKAVSAILILMLKWFKASHVLKFHYFAQLLFDSNCLLLVLKMFGLSDVAMAVQARHEWEDWNFFRYCHLNCSKNHPPPKSTSTPPPRSNPRALVSAFSSPIKQAIPLPPAGAPGIGAGQKPFPGGPGPGQQNPNLPAQMALQQPGPPVPPLPTVGRAPGDEVEIITEYSSRNFFTTINFIKILQKMTKHRSHRTYMLNQYKSSQILKRMLRVNQPMLQLQVLKLIKSQMPWCGRKWRQTNMKVITAIYLNCRPELRDEWLAGQDQDVELDDALPQETALRTLIQFYNKKHYPVVPHMLSSPEPSHRRTESTSAVTLDDPALPAHHGPRMRSASSSDGDIFPPRRTDSSSLPYNPDGMIEFWLHEYEDVLGEVFGEGEGLGDWDDLGIPPSSPRRPSYGAGFSGFSAVPGTPPRSPGLGGRGLRGSASDGDNEGDEDDKIPSPKAAERDDRAWNALGEIMGSGSGGGGAGDDAISDSESVVSVGELGENARMIDDAEAFGRMQRRRSENESTWAEMAEQTLAMLPRSPAERRRSSSSGSHGSALRPIIPPGGSIASIDVFDDDDEVDMPGPIPKARGTGDEEERGSMPVDEVEYVYGE